MSFLSAKKMISIQSNWLVPPDLTLRMTSVQTREHLNAKCICFLKPLYVLFRYDFFFHKGGSGKVNCLEYLLCLKSCTDQVAHFSVTEGNREGGCMFRQRGVGGETSASDRSRGKVVNSSRK